MSDASAHSPSLIYADWPAADSIVALSTCRDDGYSEAPFDRFNLATHVGDKPQAVMANRQLLLDSCEGLTSIQWLNQVHGTKLVRAAEKPNAVVDADASFTCQTGLACAVLTADCLPVLICDRAGQQIAAIHAGWRGLLAGVIENTLDAFVAEMDGLMAWLGPGISQPAFEVGVEVRARFLATAPADGQLITRQAFLPNAMNPGHYFADLYQLARIRLQQRGVTAIYGGEYCSYQQPDLFYSYRREARTGRMATLIYKKF